MFPSQYCTPCLKLVTTVYPNLKYVIIGLPKNYSVICIKKIPISLFSSLFFSLTDTTFLFPACFWGFYDVVKTLLDKGAGKYWITKKNNKIYVSVANHHRLRSLKLKWMFQMLMHRTGTRYGPHYMLQHSKSMERYALPYVLCYTCHLSSIVISRELWSNCCKPYVKLRASVNPLTLKSE